MTGEARLVVSEPDWNTTGRTEAKLKAVYGELADHAQPVQYTLSAAAAAAAAAAADTAATAATANATLTPS